MRPLSLFRLAAAASIAALGIPQSLHAQRPAEARTSGGGSMLFGAAVRGYQSTSSADSGRYRREWLDWAVIVRDLHGWTSDAGAGGRARFQDRAGDSERRGRRYVGDGVVGAEVDSTTIHVFGRTFPYPRTDSALVIMAELRGSEVVSVDTAWVPSRQDPALMMQQWRSGDTTFFVTPRSRRGATFESNVRQSPKVRAFLRDSAPPPVAMTIPRAPAPAPAPSRTAQLPAAPPENDSTPYGMAIAAQRARNYVESFQRFRALAPGHPIAAERLGWHYREGAGVPRDYAAAMAAYRQAANAGFGPALFEIGQMYYMGLGVARDPGQAAAWYRRAADVGSSPAQYLLGTLLERGEGIARDTAQAAALYREAARRGNVYAPAALRRLAGDTLRTASLPRDAFGALGPVGDSGMVRTRVTAITGMFSPVAMPADSIATFPLAHPAPTGVGRCAAYPTAGARMLVMTYPESGAPVAQVNVRVDSLGRISYYNELRGLVNPIPPNTRPEDVARVVAEAEARTRGTSISLHYQGRYAILRVHGGGGPSIAYRVALDAARDHPHLGAPESRARAVIAACGGTNAR